MRQDQQAANRLVTNRFAIGLLGVAMGLAVVPAATVRAAGEDRVAVGDLPRGARAVLEDETRGATEVQYYKTDSGTYVAHYTLRNGLRLESRVRKDGSGLAISPTKNQPDLNKAQAQRLFDQYIAAREGKPNPNDAERARLEAERAREAARMEVERARDAARIESDHARAEAQAELDRVRRENQQLRDETERRRELARQREEEAREDRARRLSERDAADFYVGRTYRTVDFDTAPYEVRRTLRDATRNGKNVDYYAFRQRGQYFYAAQYTTLYGRRIEIVTNEDGRVVDRIELADWAQPGQDIRNRDAAWDRDRGWDRDRDRVSRYWLPDAARQTLEDLTFSARDVDFYKIRTDDRTLYAARYTDSRGRRVESRVNARGDLLETVRTYELER